MTRRGLALLALALVGCPAGPPPPLPRADAPAPRTVTPSPALAELVVAIGAEAHLVGVSPFCDHPPRLAELPEIGGLKPNLEQLEVLAPDLLLWQGTSVLAEDYARRRGARFEAFRIETFADVAAGLERLGELFARQEAAAAEAARLEAAIAAVRARAPAARPRVLLVFGREPGGLRQIPAVGGGTFLSECLAAAGGENVLAEREGWPTLSLEGVLSLAPDVVLELVNQDAPDPAALEARLADWARYPELPAVAQGRVRAVTGSELLIPGPRLTAVLEKFARAVGE